MLSQEVVLALLQASTTGAGLVLAIYALIIPFSRRLFERNLAGFIESMKYTKGGLDWLEFKVSKENEEAGITKTKVDSIVFKSIAYPTYLRYGVGLTFLGYIATIMFCSAWVVNWEIVIVDALIVPIFVFTTLVFLVVGLIAIRDVQNLMTEDLSHIVESSRKDEDSKSTQSNK